MEESKSWTTGPACGMAVDGATALHADRDGKTFYLAATTVGTSFCPRPPAPSRRPSLEAAVDNNAVNADVISAGPCGLRSA